MNRSVAGQAHLNQSVLKTSPDIMDVCRCQLLSSATYSIQNTLRFAVFLSAPISLAPAL